MASFPRAIVFLSLFAVPGSLLAEGCKKKDDGGDFAPLEPPMLEFLRAENSAGDVFDADAASIELACDSWLTLHLGPEGSTDGTIDNWSLRPPAACSALQQCGYVAVDVLDDDDQVLLNVELAQASIPLDLSDVQLGEIAAFRATLTDGTSRLPFENDGVVVEATWEATITGGDCRGSGGAGGSGGASPTGGAPSSGGSAPGGAGGIGGATGE